jgi:hypothetical protein
MEFGMDNDYDNNEMNARLAYFLSTALFDNTYAFATRPHNQDNSAAAVIVAAVIVAAVTVTATIVPSFKGPCGHRVWVSSGDWDWVRVRNRVGDGDCGSDIYLG